MEAPEELDDDMSVPDEGEGSWLLSYSDMVTVLLFFFIIFYVIEKKMQKKETDQIYLTEKAEWDVSKSKPSVSTPTQEAGSGQPGEAAEIVDEDKINRMLFDLDSELTKSFVVQSEMVDLQYIHNRLEVNFKAAEFFDSGSYKINPTAKRALDRVLNLLKKHDDRIKIDIQGHTDSSRVVPKQGRWWKSNMELSLLRALDVYNYMSDKGFNRKSLNVTGFADNRPFEKEGASEIQDVEQLKKFNRRITLVITNIDQPEESQ